MSLETKTIDWRQSFEFRNIRVKRLKGQMIVHFPRSYNLDQDRLLSARLFISLKSKYTVIRLKVDGP